MLYLSYDIRGIQTYIFQVPKLRYIVGGSALIDAFDREYAKTAAVRCGCELVSAGGGKGALACPDERSANRAQVELVGKAHEIGADIRFGRDVDYSEAVNSADALFPFLPSPTELAGQPCAVSGLYPVSESGGKRYFGDLIHPAVHRRVAFEQGTPFHRHFERRLAGSTGLALPAPLSRESFSFLHDVDRGTAGSASLGLSNRWAIICMDGNDMGRQFAASLTRKWTPEARLDGVRATSRALDNATETACVEGLNSVLANWVASNDGRLNEFCDEDGLTVVPFRPLIVGGDDLVVLCHAQFAAEFVSTACAAFAKSAREAAGRARASGLELWPATGGEITISAGLLWCKTSMPLAAAIPYAENLLALAKRKGRQLQVADQPAPACVDFDAVTESLIDHPSTRRARELLFLDGDNERQQVALTRRPFELSTFAEVVDLSESLTESVPAGMAHQLLPSLRAGFWDRQVFRARLGKRQAGLAQWLAEDLTGASVKGSRWRVEKVDGQTTRSTDVVDMVLLAGELSRWEEERA